METRLSVHSDDHFMKLALREAQKAYDQGEVPVGAVVVYNNQVIAKAHNQVEMLTDVTAHAEILAITAAANHLGAKFLDECALYVSLEPCPMCAGAIRHARFDRLIYGAGDEKQGFMNYGKAMIHPKTKLEFGILHDQCKHILQSFFAERRSVNG